MIIRIGSPVPAPTISAMADGISESSLISPQSIQPSTAEISISTKAEAERRQRDASKMYSNVPKQAVPILMTAEPTALSTIFMIQLSSKNSMAILPLRQTDGHSKSPD